SGRRTRKRTRATSLRRDPAPRRTRRPHPRVLPSCRVRRDTNIGALHDVHIPKMGMSTVEVDVVAVHVRVGDTLEPSTILIGVESEKANYELEAGHAGTVREVLVSAGDMANVGDVIARIDVSALLVSGWSHGLVLNEGSHGLVEAGRVVPERRV